MTFGGWESSDHTFEDHHLGYTKVGSTWGIALSITTGNRIFPEDSTDEGEWLFNDAPRALRAEAVDKLPDLVEKLVLAAEQTTAEIRAKNANARELATTVAGLARPKK